MSKFGCFELLLASASFSIILQDVLTFIKDVYISLDETVCGGRYFSDDEARMSSWSSGDWDPVELRDVQRRRIRYMVESCRYTTLKSDEAGEIG